MRQVLFTGAALNMPSQCITAGNMASSMINKGAAG